MHRPEPVHRLSERERSEAGAPAASDSQRAYAPGRAAMTVLLVDDVIDARDMYALYFRHVGVKVTTASDGQSALTAARVERPDVIVLDLAMPGLTGWDVLRELKADPRLRGIPVLVLSGQRAKEDALKAGADAYCEKPCLPDKLFGAIMRVLYGA